MNKMFNRVNEAGTMLVEAMAMLGLIAMVTPILYKKAAERTTELQDINAANQLRVLSNAMDAYIKDNFTRINNNEVVKNSCDEGTVDYKDFDDNTKVVFGLSHLCEYLPYGFLKDGKTQDTKLFTTSGDSFKVVLRRTTGTETAEDGSEVVVAQTVTGFLTAIPNEGTDFPSTRTSRIATMVGSNGGYVENDGTIMGAQGIWSLSGDSELGVTLPTNSFVVSSLQPISSQGLANEDVLHRKTERQNDYVLNAMETDLFMSYNDKNHNIRQVNQIIMSPQPEWMLGGDQNDFKRNVDDTPKSELSEYKADLDHTLYIGSKGGAFIEGNMAALDSLFTVRSEAGGDDGGIKYYATDSTTDSTDPSNPVTTNSRGANIFSVTTAKMEYGNIGAETAGALLTVSKEDNSMEFESKTSSTPAGGGTPTTSSQKLIAANAERVNLIDGALSIRNPGVAADGGKYDEYDTNKWPEQNAAPAVIVGGGDVHKASYTTYEYNDDGTPKTDGAGNFVSSDLDGEHALTVNGPAFVKDSLKTAKLKAYNVDAAKLRAGVRPEDFNDVTEDPDFYMVAEKKGTDDGRLLVGHYTDAASGENRYRLQISEAEETITHGDGTSSVVQKGVRFDHENGLNLRAGNTDVNVGLIEHDVAAATSSVNSDTADGQIKLGAYNAISLATIGSDGNFIDKSVVSIQDDMLRAYNDAASGSSLGYIDSITDYARFMSRGAQNGGFTHDDLYARSSDNNLFALGDMDFSITELGTGTDSSGNTVTTTRPVADIRAARSKDYVSSRFSGGFAVYDHDVTGGDYPDDGSNMGNAALYVNKGDFRVLATESNADATLDITKGDTILQVDNNSDTDVIPDDDDRGSVYIRKGAINLATSGNTRLLNSEIVDDYRTDETKYPVGYISADRFIAHTVPAAVALNSSTTSVNSGGDIKGTDGKTVTPYEKYEVNPAYTSVMNDIKLTTRGGARLSDILPDFINRGIYVVDNTFKDEIKWVGATSDALKGSEVTSGSAEAFTSAYLGFVPAPTCPPGYSKVITINPSGWAMAQAGTPVYRDSKIDINSHNNPYLYWYTQNGELRTTADEIEPVNPLTFQKNNWLKAMVMPECDGKFQSDGKCTDSNLKTFKGWGTVMGFIYPAAYYDDFINGNVGGHNVGGGNANTNNEQDTVYWNLYPVHYRELEAYVTVYCYFRRAAFDSDYVDTSYDQLNGTRRDFWDKSSATNIDNLNDPALKYNDPW